MWFSMYIVSFTKKCEKYYYRIFLKFCGFFLKGKKAFLILIKVNCMVLFRLKVRYL
jgi:hypothetical protein